MEIRGGEGEIRDGDKGNGEIRYGYKGSGVEGRGEDKRWR